MTLSTDVYILDEVDPEQVFRFCQEMLTKYDDPRYLSPAAQKVRNEQDGDWEPLVRYDGVTLVWAPRAGAAWSRDNEPAQNLPAWLMTAYRPDGPLRAEARGHDEGCEDDCDGNYHDRACWMSVDFDTAYGYRDKRGWGCGDLHAALVAELGAWLTSRGVRWEWRNEFTGEVHVGPEGLVELGPGGAEAQDWYVNTALPAILSHAVEGGPS